MLNVNAWMTPSSKLWKSKIYVLNNRCVAYYRTFNHDFINWGKQQICNGICNVIGRKYATKTIFLANKSGETSYKYPASNSHFKPVVPSYSDTCMPNDMTYTLYSNKGKESKCRIMFTAGLIVLVLCGSIVYTISSYLLKQNANNNSEDHPWWTLLHLNNAWAMAIVTSLLIAAGAVAVYYMMVFPAHMVRIIKLQKGGDKIYIQTYGPFGLKRVKITSLNDVSAQLKHKDSNLYMPIKIRGKRHHFMIFHTGNFPNKPLFNQTVGLYRKF